MTSVPVEDGLLVQLANQKKLFLSNEILLQEATAPLVLLESVRARGVNSPQWRRCVGVENESIEIYESVSDAREQSVIVQLDVKCHVMEVYNALTADTTEIHETMLRGLHGRRFRRGTVLHTFEEASAVTQRSSGEDGSIAVKSASFTTKSLSKESDFYYVDYRKCFPERKAVVHISKSLPKEFHDHLAKHSVLGGAKDVTACTYAEQIAGHKTRIFFFATCTLDDETEGPKSPNALERATLFLSTLANAFTHLETLVERRRLGYQSFLAHGHKHSSRSMKNCKVCDKSFGVLRLEHACQLCGYRTCSGCSFVRDIETTPGVLRSKRICRTCLDAVNNCVFDDDDLELLGSSPIADFAVTVGPSFTQMQAELASTTHRVVVLKKRVTSQADDEALKLIEYLFSSDPTKQATAMERFGVTSSEKPLDSSVRLLEGILRLALAQPTRLTVNECLVAEPNQTRSYLLNFEEGLRIATAPPVLYEHIRLDLIARLGLLDTRRFVSEPFNVVCEIAARVMDCRTAYISVVGTDLQHAVAHFNQPLLKLPRRETICAYALTSDRPFIVRNALHDMRFRDFFCVARGGVQFYASFPIVAPSTLGGGVVASLVTVDREPKRVITNRQYARMIVLTHVLTELLGTLPAP